VTPQSSDEFDSPKLGLQWQWHANHSNEWFSLTARKGSLRLVPQASGPEFSSIPSLLLQKFPASAFTVETNVRLEKTSPGTRAGLVVMGESHAALALEEEADALALSLVVDGSLVERRTVAKGPVALRAALETGGACHFGYAASGEKHIFAHEFFAKPGRWIGAKVGLFAITATRATPSGYADFEYFRFAPPR